MFVEIKVGAVPKVPKEPKVYSFGDQSFQRFQYNFILIKITKHEVPPFFKSKCITKQVPECYQRVNYPKISQKAR